MNNKATQQQKIDKAFQKARQMSNSGDQYKLQGNFEKAGNCYTNVTIILGAIKKQSQKADIIQTLTQKIDKFKELAQQMYNKKNQGLKKQTKIAHFGFPQVKRMSLPYNIQPQKLQINQPKMQPKQISQPQKVQIDADVTALVAKDIKASFSDIVGMAELKQILYQAVIIPQKRPDLFEGIRSPPRGILLYGPPGNGKTFITKALAKESGCTFFGLSAGSIMNKFVGQSQKMLRKVFESAKKSSPSIIFIDQIDSMLTSRSQNENDSSRRLKTQFLVQFDNLEGSQTIVIGATNLPNQLDLAALRRFNKLVYVGLPDKESRRGIVEKNLLQVKYQLGSSDMTKLVKQLDGYSASEITDVVKQACMMPIRQISKNSIQVIDKSKIRPVKYDDFARVLKAKKPLLTKQDLKKYEGKFNK